MNNGHVQNILNIRYQTQILESLGWDEQKFTQLFEYLNNEFTNFDLKHPAELLKVIENHFGKATSDVFVEIFDEQLKLILAQNSGAYDEH